MRCVQAGDSFFPLSKDRGQGLADGRPVLVGLRPDAIKMGDKLEKMPKRWHCTCEVVLSEILGGHSLLEVVVDGVHTMIAEVEGRVMARPGEIVPIGFEFDRMVLFDPETTDAIG